MIEIGTITLRTGKMEVTKDYLSECHVRGEFERDTCVFLEVVDTGIGIDSEDLEKIFDLIFHHEICGARTRPGSPARYCPCA